MTPFILDEFGVEYEHAPAESAEVVMCGSVIQNLPRDFSGTVLGSGIISDVEHNLPSAEVPFVRGRRTAHRIGRPRAVVADPGLLVSDLVETADEKIYDVGVVPHYVDLDTEFVQRVSDFAHVIDVRRRPDVVAAEISRCQRILSSSLHGLIAADSMGIPATWTVVSGDVVGGGFKFRDYETSLPGRARKPVPPDTVEDKQSLEASIPNQEVDVAESKKTARTTIKQYLQ